MDNSSMNYDVLHQFFEGYKTDLDNHAEGNKSFVKGINGRLFSENGILSYSSINGTKRVYENPDIVKYLGWAAFKDELIVFTKVQAELAEEEQTCTDVVNLITKPITINYPYSAGNIFEGYYDETVVEVCIPSVPIDENEFNTPISCVGPENDVSDYGDLFNQIPVLPLEYCPIFDNDVPVNNQQYKDAVWSFTYNPAGTITAKLLWVGNMNLSMTGKICAIGVEENIFFKRVYFTDYENYFRVINLKDKSLKYRRPNEFNVSVSGTLLSPRIVEKRNNGTLKAMSVTYMFRLINENGQVTDFSPASEMVRINKVDGTYKYSGGGISEATNHSVLISAIVPDHTNFSEIEMIAVEFEGKDVPTAILTIGRQPVGFYNEFEHFGNESEFEENITLADLFANSINFKYISDMQIKNNKMVVVGLRNDPSFVNSENINIDFALHGFHFEEGQTHDCLLNPNPERFKYIDTQMNAPFFFVSKRIYRQISVLGNFWVRLENKLTGEFYQYNASNGTYVYQDRLLEILQFLLDIQELPDFATNFPNLQISNSDAKILFHPINGNLEVDFYNYNLVFSTPQVIIDSDNAIQLKEFSWPLTTQERNNRLVYGAVSNGFFNGNGVRVTVKKQADHVMSKNTDWHRGSGPILQLQTPTLKKGCMKGEIYRLGIQWYKDGNRLFTTILGDFKIPEIGQIVREYNPFDNTVFYGQSGNNLYYQNMAVDGNMMFANRLELQFEVKISCELSRQVDAYQIVYVERTEENRSILAQGISAPLHRMLQFDGTKGNHIDFDQRLTNKWNLPYYGGPIIDAQGLRSTDAHPDNDNPDIDGTNFNWQNRIQTSRDLIYFDSPDLIYDQVSDKNLESCVLEYVNSIRTDHDTFNIVGGYNRETTNNNNQNNDHGTEIVFADGGHGRDDNESAFGAPKFSQKIPFSSLSLVDESKPYFVNVSVFSNILRTKQYFSFDDETTKPYLQAVAFGAQFGINAVATAEEGQQISGFKMNQAFDLVNAAAVLSSQGWWYNQSSRIKYSYEFSTFRVNNISNGRKTLFLQTDRDWYVGRTVNQEPYMIKSWRSFGTNDHNGGNTDGYDAHLVGNIRRKSTDSLYGGRTEYAYSRNEFIAMSEVMPVIKNNVANQVFMVQGDTYCSPFIRNKNSYRDAAVPENRTFAYRDSGKPSWTRYGAWCYAVVLESTVEPRLNYSEEFYRLEDNFNFYMEEQHNPAYLQLNNLRKSIPTPLNFKDDPNASNTVAVSDPKLSGDYYDAFTRYRTNEFLELDKNKGAALNIAKQEDQLFVIQEHQTVLLYMDERAMITPDNGGAPIQVAQGTGTSLSGHEVISTFGTSIRRAVVPSKYGFVFFDERNREFIKIKDPLLEKNQLSLFYNTFFKENPIVDVEGFFDYIYKETNLRFRTQSGKAFILSYNEALGCFNGEWAIDGDIFPIFQERILVPYNNSQRVGELNNGEVLRFFEQPKLKMYLKIVSASDSKRTQIAKGIAVHININYPIVKTIFETSLGQIRTILGTHHWYKIREGVHTLPSKNMMDPSTDIRGEWVSVDMEVESRDNNKINIYSIVNYLRNSYK